ncbi:MAG TPA: hypothetical protein VGD69_13265 [Herpetosiphonaceae bacterium]
MNVVFGSTSVAVKGSGTYTGSVPFSSPVATAEVALRGLNLDNYTDGTLYHYRGPTIVNVNDVNISGSTVSFTFAFNFSQNVQFEMDGSINFLVVATTE